MLEQYFKNIYQFLSRYQDIWQKEVLEQNPLHPLLDKWASDIATLDLNSLVMLENKQIMDNLPAHIYSLLSKINELENRISKLNIEDLTLATNRKIGTKKKHEICGVINLIKKKDISPIEVYDFGGGVGHLCENLSQHLSIPTNCVERDEKLIESGKLRIARYTPLLKDKVAFINKEIGPSFTMPSKTNGLAIGLHACGSLTNYLINFYLQSNNKYFISFGCCYHKYSIEDKNIFNLSQLAKRFNLNLSNHAHTLAAKSGTIITDDLLKKRIKVKRFRYSFHFLLSHFFYKNDFISLGNYSKSLYDLSFIDYTNYFLRRLNLQLADEQIINFYENEKLQTKIDHLIRAGILRGLFGRLLEIYIVLDRALFLQDNGKNVEVVSVFKASISPRNLAIISR